MELGFDEIYLHYVGQEQQRFIEVFGENSPDSTYDVAAQVACASR